LFQSVLGTPPRNRDFRFVEAGVDLTSMRFVTLSHVDLGLREQDFDVGLHASLIGGRSPSGIWRIRSDDSYGYVFGPRSFVLTRLAGSTRGGAVNRDAITSADVRWVTQSDASQPQTFVARARV